MFLVTLGPEKTVLRLDYFPICGGGVEVVPVQAPHPRAI